ncbi:hypothetical protein [Salinibacter altiplanensis]|uniref:hypothetical protein n=1 Tax=Salinibacter altiplanensis TaxID=1803181 RepID=UPI0018F870EB|nr:hypothetical protein [Salinibacter altiplanensis]
MTQANSPSDQEESVREEPSAEKEPSTEKEPPAGKVAGTWHITDMEVWDEDYFNMETQAYIRVEEGGTGDFQFGLVTGSIDGHVEEVGTDPRFTFTWEGRGEMDPMSGGGWLRPIGDNQAEGMIKIHRGDRSQFQARRVS